MLWYIELKFCIWLCFTVLQSKFECRQFASIFVGIMPLLELKLLEIHSFPHFSLTCFDILSWNFAYDFVLLYYRSSSSTSVVNLRQFLWELCSFWNLNYWKYSFPHFLLHALTYWAEILHMTLFQCTTDQVWVSSICVNFCWSYAPFGSLNTGNTQFSALFSYMLWHIELKFCIWLCFTVLQIKFECRQFLCELCPFLIFKYCKYTVFRTFLLHALTYWVEILHMTLFYCTTDQVRVSSIFVGVMPLLELRILKIYSFPHFFLTCTWLCFTEIKINFDCRQFASIFFWELCPFWNFEYLKYAVYFSLTCFGILSWNFSCDFL